MSPSNANAKASTAVWSKGDAVEADFERVRQAIHCLQRLSEVFQRRREQLAAGVGVTEREWRVLDEISSEGEEFIPSLFARRRESTPAAVSKILRQLIDKGLVSVAVSKVDGRQREYQLTAKGKRLMARLRRQREKAIEEIWLDMDPAAMTAFTSFGSQLAERLEDYAARTDGTR